MQRYAAFLRGVSPLNAKMSEVKTTFERAGFEDVKTLLSSGNVVFTSRRSSSTTLEKNIERALEKHLGRTFLTIVRSIDDLNAILEADPYRSFKLRANSKRVVTFLRNEPKGRVS